MIEAATIQDLPTLCELLGELFAQESDFTPDTQKQAAGLRLILENPTCGSLFVMRRAGEIVGMVNLLWTAALRHGGRALVLEDLIVRRDARDQGIATALLEHAIHFARSNHAVRITLFTDATNELAIRLYQKMGFAHSASFPMRRQTICDGQNGPPSGYVGHEAFEQNRLRLAGTLHPGGGGSQAARFDAPIGRAQRHP